MNATEDVRAGITTAFLADAISKLHDTGPGHPEQPARWDAAVRGLGDHPITAAEHRSATPDELALCHTVEYIRLAKHDVESGYSALSTGDTDISAQSWNVAVRAAGTCLTAIDLVMRGEARNAFCIVRPPGHHAGPSRGMGFCLFNNIAIAARYAQKRYGVDRVAIADWDVHHGNGTQDIFYADPSVFFFSTHQSPWYPGTGDTDETGEGAGKGTTLNRPFAAGAGREEIIGALANDFGAAMRDYRPALLLISAGFDSRIDDPLGRFRLQDPDFAELTALILEMADKYAGGRVVSVLEGGYNLTGLTRAVGAHVQTLHSAAK
ncbi:MAG TPA: histone deacetylase [Candidatus Acidoferrales bacterium]|nr:histone deacetylase [Candidatus Acidoferrales bacterium]